MIILACGVIFSNYQFWEIINFCKQRFEIKFIVEILKRKFFILNLIIYINNLTKSIIYVNNYL
jgi:hypothetical protein